MRIASLVTMVITFLIAIGITFLSSFSSIKLGMKKFNPEEITKAKKIIETSEKIITELKAEGKDTTSLEANIIETKKLVDSVPSSFSITLSKMISIITILLAIGMLFLTFKKDSKLTKVTVAVLVSSLLLVLITPHFDNGKYGAASAKTTALVGTCFMLITSLCAFASYKLYLKKQ